MIKDYMKKEFLIAAIICWILALFCILGIADAATYYVDTTCTDTNPASATVDGAAYDSVTPACTGGSDSYFVTIADLNAAAATTAPGDTISFRKGQTWRDHLNIPESGSAGLVYTYTSHGSGADPIISGADIEASWNSEAVGGEDFTDGSGDYPEAYWYFEEESGTRYDETVNNNDMEDINTVTRSATKQQGSYSALFEDDNDEELRLAYADVSSDFPLKQDPTTDFTIGGWVYFTKAWDDDDAIFSFKNSSNSEGIQIRVNDNKIEAQWYDNPDWKVTVADDAASTTTWYHVAVRWQGSTDDQVALFIDGLEQTDTETTAAFIEMTGDNLRFGNRNTVDRPAAVLLDEWFAFDTALSDGQILAIKNTGLAGDILSWYATGWSSDPNQVFEDGVRLAEVANKVDLTTGTWWWDDPNDRVYIRTTGDDDPSGYTVEISARDYNITASGPDYITIDGLTLKNAREKNIFTSNASTNWTVQNTTATYAYSRGIHFGGGSIDALIDSCIVSYAGQTGIEPEAQMIVRDSEIHHNAIINQGTGAGIHAYGTGGREDILIENNYLHDNGPAALTGNMTGIGIWIDGRGGTPGYQTSATIIRYNLIENDKTGIMLEIVSNASVYGNVIHDLTYETPYWYSGTGIVLMEGVHDNLIYNNTIEDIAFGLGVRGDGTADDVTGNIFKNNIVANYSNRFLDTRNGGENDGTNGSGNVYTYNCFDVESTNFVQWGSGVYYSTYDAWETAYGGTTNSIESDPLLTNPGADDFTLQAGSPARNGAVYLPGYTIRLRPGSSWPDNVLIMEDALTIGAYGYLSVTGGVSIQDMHKAVIARKNAAASVCPSWDSSYAFAWDGSFNGGTTDENRDQACTGGSATLDGTNTLGAFSGSGAATIWTSDGATDQLTWALSSSEVDVDAASGWTVCMEIRNHSMANSDNHIWGYEGNGTNHLTIRMDEVTSSTYNIDFRYTGTDTGKTADGTATLNANGTNWYTVGGSWDIDETEDLSVYDSSDWLGDEDSLAAWIGTESEMGIHNLITRTADTFDVRKLVIVSGFEVKCPWLP